MKWDSDEYYSGAATHRVQDRNEFEMNPRSKHPTNRQHWGLPFFLVAVGVFNIVSFFALGSISRGVFIREFEIFLIGCSSGQLMVVLIVGGLFGRYWLKGIVLGSLLATCWIACIFVGEHMGGLNIKIRYLYFAFAVPALVLGGTFPLLICRYIFGWHLSKNPKSFSGRRQFSLEELFFVMTAIVSVFLLCRVPQYGPQFPIETVFRPIAILIGVMALCCLLVAMPVLVVVFLIRIRSRRWMAFVGIVVLYYVLLTSILLMFGLGGGNMAVLFSVLWILGFLSIQLLGLTSMRISGYDLAHSFKKQDSLPAEVAEREARMERSNRQRWVIGVLSFSILACAGTLLIDTSRTRAEQANLDLFLEMQKLGNSIDVMMGKVIELKFGPETTDQALGSFQGLEDIQLLSLAHTQLSDAGLHFLSKFPNLNRLDLSYTQVTNAGLIELQKLKKLQHISLAHTKVTLPKLVHAKSLVECSSLDLSGLQITDDQLSMLWSDEASFETLSLYLRDNLLSDAGLAKFFKEHNGVFKTLDLSGNPLDGSCLSELRKIETLILERLPLTDASLGAVMSPTGLFIGPSERIVLSRNNITEGALGTVLPSCGVTLGEGTVTDADLANCKVPMIQVLKLRGRSFDASCFETWHPMMGLLDLEGSGLTDETVKYLSNVRFSILNLTDTEITDAALPHLSSARFLNPSRTRITFDGLRSAYFKDLQMMQLAVGQFSVEEIRILKRKLPIVVGKTMVDLLQYPSDPIDGRDETIKPARRE